MLTPKQHIMVVVFVPRAVAKQLYALHQITANDVLRAILGEVSFSSGAIFASHKT